MTDQPTTEARPTCTGCGHDAHHPGTECDDGVDHPDQKRWHRCLCLNLVGVETACHPQMTCQGGTLGYSDAWHLQRQPTATVRDAARQASGQQPDTCRPIDVDGTTVLVRGAGDWTDEDRAHAAELARAARRRFESEPRCPACKHLWTNHEQGACVIRSRSQGVATVCGCTEIEPVPAAGLSDTQPANDQAVQWDGTAKDATRVIDWVLARGGTATYRCSGSGPCPDDGDTPHHLTLRTSDGLVQVSPGARITLTTTWTVEEDEAHTCPDGESCPQHDEPAEQRGEETPDRLAHVGWWCWRGNDHGHLADTACRSDNVPIHVPTEWATEMRAVIEHLTDTHQPGQDCTWVTPEEQAAETAAAADVEEDETR